MQKGDVIDLETYVHYSKTKKRTWRKIGATVAGLAIGSLPYLLDKKDQRQEIGKVNRDLLKVAAPLAGAGVASLPFVLKDREGRPISPHVTMPTDRNGLFVPNAYLKYNLYDSQGILVKSAYQMIDKQAKDAWQKLYLHEEVQEDGFVSIELGNHSKQPTWFEAFKLTKRTYMDVNDSDKPEKIWALLRT